MIDRLLEAWGIDPVQWRALVATYVRMDMRRGAGPRQRGQPASSGALPFAALLIINAMTGAMLAVMAVALDDIRTFATVLTTYTALNTGLLLLVDFTGLVVSPDDYRVLSSRPVDSRTYFAARLFTILLYVATISAVLGFLPALVLWLWRGLGMATAAATLVAVLASNLCAAVLVICAYAALIEHVHPRRLTRVLSYAQLGGSTLFLAGYYVAVSAFDNDRLRALSLADTWWMWFNPARWFASVIATASGVATTADLAGSAAAVLLTIGCLPLASGRISLAYAERLAEIGTSSEPARERKSIMTRLPGFSQGEARAVALLVRAQFRYDNRFRLAILSLLPVTIFYIFLGLDDGALADPFLGFAAGGVPMYFATVFLPMTIHASLLTSDSWRAAWVFFSTPADPARLIVAAKNFVTVWFLGAYLLLLAVVWSVFFERIWHAFVHALVLGLLSHLILQGAVIVRPSLPFASEPQHAQRTAQLFGLFLLGGVAAALVPLALPFVYARVTRTIFLFGFLIAVTAATEYALRLRAREAVLDMEFQS